MSFEFDVSNPLFFVGLLSWTIAIWFKPHIHHKYLTYYESSLNEKKISYPPQFVFPLMWTLLNILLITGWVIYWWTEPGNLGVDIDAHRWYIGIMLIFFGILILRYIWCKLFWYVPEISTKESSNSKRFIKGVLWLSVIIIMIMIILSVFIICAISYRLSISLNYIVIFTIIAMLLFTLWLFVAAYFNIRILFNYNRRIKMLQ
jgi:hypothetical protein